MISVIRKIFMRSGLYIVFLFAPLFLFAQPTTSIGPSQEIGPEKLLQSPRRSVHTFLHWQQEGHRKPNLVIQTMRLATNTTQQERLELAQKLRMVLDARGLIINYEAIPNQEAYVDTLSGLHQYILFDALPEVYLVRQDSMWVFSKATIDRIPSLYRAHFSWAMDFMLEHLPDVFSTTYLGLQLWQFGAILLLIILGLILRKLFEFFIHQYALKLARKSETTWDDQLLYHIERPAGFTLLMTFFWLFYTNIQLSVTTNYYLSTFLEIAVSGGLVWLLYNLSNVLSDYLTELTADTESKLDDQLVPLIRKSLKVFIVVLGILFILQNNGINVASLIAGLGLGGLAFALAARDTLANLFGSITIFLDKPFQIGDWIKTPTVEGTVEEVGFRSTRIRTFHNSLISVPNAKMADAEVDNLGLREYRRLKTVLNLTYDTSPKQMEAFVEGIKAIITANEYMRQDFYEVHFYNYGAHSLDVLVYCFFDVETWSEELQQRHNFFLEIMRLAQQVGVEFAFPTQTLHVDSFFGDQPRRAAADRTEEELVAAATAFGPNGALSNPNGPILKKDGQPIDFAASLKRSGS
ncbi:MAG: mechanosensitive ion channel family protein [Bacteroidota bacterium]